MSGSFDYDRSLDRLGGDDELLAEIADILVHNAPSQLAQVRQWVERLYEGR